MNNPVDQLRRKSRCHCDILFQSTFLRRKNTCRHPTTASHLQANQLANPIVGRPCPGEMTLITAFVLSGRDHRPHMIDQSPPAGATTPPNHLQSPTVNIRRRSPSSINITRRGTPHC
ncbi:unnamed protein product [Lactuca virosa]|uniref:Uncharacterized protein n=1 Tax=Lactuca virosa TaxID=75947 RepID=A0AAU9PRQ8_9ASTR|nr:unnamed protein product [Lactuca virosa]